MVHVKRVKLSHFKSFGGTTSVPLLPGFTVISGPNGSGKSNILDAILFCLGLSSSKGMRADRLPDLVNHKHSQQRGTSETIVTVTFDLSDVDPSILEDEEEFQVTTLDEEDLEALANSDQDGRPTGIENNNENGEESAVDATIDEDINPDDMDAEDSENNGNGNHPREWSVTRRLRVTQGGNYSSNYYINGVPSTATEIHEQLNRLRIYPEGYNVVLQGDVTSIISMNSRERREIIDELAGVAAFDRKIDRARITLDEVREREDRCRIIETELQHNLERLERDRVKAEKYKKIKAQIQEYQQWEVVLTYRCLEAKAEQLQQQLTAGNSQLEQLNEQLSKLTGQIQTETQNLDTLNARVKELGEEEQLSVSSKLATQRVQRQQLQQKQQELEKKREEIESAISQTQQAIQDYEQALTQNAQQQAELSATIQQLETETNQAKATLEASRTKASEVADASEAWVQEQTALTRQVNNLQATLNPQRTELAQLTERYQQLQQKTREQGELLQSLEQETTIKQNDITQLAQQQAQSEAQAQTLAQCLASAEAEQSIQQDTRSRLLREQRDKQRQLDKLEATNQAQQEAQGTFATKILMETGIPGICGLVAQLGQVEPRFQLALETAAGGRMGQLVVEDDSVAAAAIELLKQKRGGRATFLPLNKIRASRFQETMALRYANGFVDYAVNLITCEPRYDTIFAYVFGSTAVFEDMNTARSFIGQCRMVTLEGELLEASGAMTGGSQSRRTSLHFGTAQTGESEELKALRQRLEEIERILERCEMEYSDLSVRIKQLTQELTEARQQQREQQLRLEQLQKELQRLGTQTQAVRSQLAQNSQECDTVQQRLQILTAEVPQLETQLQQLQQQLTQLEESQSHSEWQQMQGIIKTQEAEVRRLEQELGESQGKMKDGENARSRLKEKLAESQTSITTYQQQQGETQQQLEQIAQQETEITQKITGSKQLLEQLAAKLGEEKQKRDNTEKNLRLLQNQHQQQTWQKQQTEQQQQERQETLIELQQQLAQQKTELPDPLPEIPNLIANEDSETIAFADYDSQLEQLQKQIRNAQKRLEALEPVNMLALEEYEQTQKRLQELTDKLTTIQGERTELLLRVENFTTLRFRAFQEAFDAVNQNFQNIFATLSDGDGYLALDNPEDPFAGGLNLVAHPKGKPVQRLSSMSGGEKSLTALSFIFALQRYRPSPFYAFDEVDMFLDGANVERLSKMIRQQAEQAQFIVVSLRRPMIEAADRTIGVTQARGAHTQVLGIKL
jgi:chromosome segregation protein